MFGLLDVISLLTSFNYFYMRISHRTPWGYWRTIDRANYAEARRTVWWAPAGWVYGILWLFTHGLLAVSFHIYVRYFSPINGCSQALYIVLLALFFLDGNFDRFWDVLFFDYTHYNGALAQAYPVVFLSMAIVVVMGIGVGTCTPTAPTWVGGSDLFPVIGKGWGWAALSLVVLYCLWWVYLLIVTHAFASRWGTGVEEAKRFDADSPHVVAPPTTTTTGQRVHPMSSSSSYNVKFRVPPLSQ